MPPTVPDCCPDCQGKLQLVHLKFATRADMTGEQGQLHFINARFDVSGAVKSYRCDGCTRIFLFG